MSFGVINGKSLRKKLNSGGVNICSNIFNNGKITGTVITTIALMMGARPSDSIHFTSSFSNAKSIIRNGLRPSKTGFFGGGSYTSTGNRSPYNPFVPSGSKVPVRITDMKGYLRVFPGTYLKPTIAGYMQFLSMASAYGYLVNFCLHFVNENKCGCERENLWINLSLKKKSKW